MLLRLPLYKAVAPVSPFFSVKSNEMSSKKRHKYLDAYKAPASASPFFFSRKVTKRLLKMPHLDDSAVTSFYKWPLNSILHKKLSLRLFCRKY